MLWIFWTVWRTKFFAIFRKVGTHFAIGQELRTELRHDEIRWHHASCKLNKTGFNLFSTPQQSCAARTVCRWTVHPSPVHWWTVHCFALFICYEALKIGYDQGIANNCPGMNSPAMNCLGMSCPSVLIFLFFCTLSYFFKTKFRKKYHYQWLRSQEFIFECAYFQINIPIVITSYLFLVGGGACWSKNMQRFDATKKLQIFICLNCVAS